MQSRSTHRSTVLELTPNIEAIACFDTGCSTVSTGLYATGKRITVASRAALRIMLKPLHLDRVGAPPTPTSAG